MPNIDPAWIALIGTLCGGLGLKLLEHYLGKAKMRVDEAAKLRDELRLEISSQRDEIKSLSDEVEKYRRDYYDLRDKYSQLNTEYLIALQKIKDTADEAAKVVDETLDPTE